MAHINISIPDDLKERMDKYDSIDWSQAASESFAKKINEIESVMEAADMIGVVARLRASKAKYDDLRETRGHADGVDWAMKDAQYDALIHLRKFYEEYKQNGHFVESLSQLDHIVNGTSLNTGMFDEDTDNQSYLEGFVKGALEVFGEVEKAWFAKAI